MSVGSQDGDATSGGAQGAVAVQDSTLGADGDTAIRIESWLSEAEERSLATDVLDGLTRPFKELPPKHFYDARGSELFARICELPEYYPTRTETKILEHHAAEIIAATGAGELVELGSGAADKARILLDAMAAAGTLCRYIPLDVSESVVREAARGLVRDYGGLQVHGVIGDFERHLDQVPPRGDAPRIVALLGGTIGNFPPGSRRVMLRKIGALLGPGDRLLLGTDLVKDPDGDQAAYDDPQGVTAEFNRNVLHVINRELAADFSPEGFEHVAFFDPATNGSRCVCAPSAAVGARSPALALSVEFLAGEELRTEISAKFTRERVERDFAAAGLRLDAWYTDEDSACSRLSLGRFATPWANRCAITGLVRDEPESARRRARPIRDGGLAHDGGCA